MNRPVLTETDRETLAQARRRLRVLEAAHGFRGAIAGDAATAARALDRLLEPAPGTTPIVAPPGPLELRALDGDR